MGAIEPREHDGEARNAIARDHYVERLEVDAACEVQEVRRVVPPAVEVDEEVLQRAR